MAENKKQTDRHLDTPSESNREKHINFRDVEEESAENFSIDNNSTERQKQWNEGVKEGREQVQDEDNDTPSAIPIDGDDIGCTIVLVFIKGKQKVVNPVAGANGVSCA